MLSDNELVEQICLGEESAAADANCYERKRRTEKNSQTKKFMDWLY